MGIYGFFVEPLSSEFGVGVAMLNVGPVALLLVPAILGSWVGKMADQLPIRNILLDRRYSRHAIPYGDQLRRQRCG